MKNRAHVDCFEYVRRVYLSARPCASQGTIVHNNVNISHGSAAEFLWMFNYPFIENLLLSVC